MRTSSHLTLFPGSRASSMALCCQPISRARSGDHLAAVESGLSHRGPVNTDITTCKMSGVALSNNARCLHVPPKTIANGVGQSFSSLTGDGQGSVANVQKT